MRLRSLLVMTGPLLLALPGCTSDLPAPHDFDVLEPPPPPNELQLDCEAIPLTANEAQFAFIPIVDGLIDGVTYVYSAIDLPAGLAINEGTGEISGIVEADAGEYSFELVVEDLADGEKYSATTQCNLTVNPKISAPLALDAMPHCLRQGDDLRDLVLSGTGDGTEILCSYRSGNGNGRLPTGLTVEEQDCVASGTIDEDRFGTWVFIMEGEQSGATVHVPYCVTNDEPQGYDITAEHSGETGAAAALLPITRTYDPRARFDVGVDMNPRYSVLAPGACGASCFYRYSFLRTNAPIDENGGFTLSPDGLVQDDMSMAPIGFFHELRISGPAVPEEFIERPWVLSTAVSYCITDDKLGCQDPANDGDGVLEFAVVMVPDPG